MPQNIYSSRMDFKRELPEINQLRISRCVKFAVDSQLVQLHGFCDASQRAYGACIYVRTRIGTNEYRTELLCSKSRVAPLKAVTLPRLELSAAVLLAHLMKSVVDSIDILNLQIFLWSDSTIALNWLTSPSRKWSVFVANRVGEIQRLTRLESWRHVLSIDNPADILSRGVHPRGLIENALWWHGPPFLRLDEGDWPSSEFLKIRENLPEEKVVITMIVTSDSSIVDELLTRYSNVNKICRILAYCFRFKKAHRPTVSTTFISAKEMSDSLHAMCRIVQGTSFFDEYKVLSKGAPLNTSSRLLSLSPFMDKTGLLRVGGRLDNSDLNNDVRHPILLPHNHELTRRLILYEHVRNLHAGAQSTMTAVRQRFWPLSLRSVTRKVIRNCVICFKAKPVQSEAKMAPLPSSRVTISRPFSRCGVDYAGPVILREGKRRNARNHKAYIAIFVCFVTKAAHIELVNNLTSEAFIAALRRFISRRGKPICICSDNGTTFVGASRELRELFPRNS